MRFPLFWKKFIKTKEIHIFLNHNPNLKTQNFLKFFAGICKHMSYFHFLHFTLSSSREAAGLYLDGNFPQRYGALNLIVSIP